MKIVFNAGHGPDTLGKRSPDGMKEFEFNLAVVNYMRFEIEKYHDVQILFSHANTRDIPLNDRTNFANNEKADLYVSIHANAFTDTWSDAKGIETYVYTGFPRDATELAEKVQKHLVKSTGREDRGVKEANFHELRETNMPAILCECGFMTHREESQLLRSDGYRKTCAIAIVNGIVEQYGLKKKDIPTKLYKVQVGAFEKRENAEQLLKDLQRQGYRGFITE